MRKPLLHDLTVVSSPTAAVIAKVKAGESPPFRPRVPEDAFSSSQVRSIMKMCWAENPEDRPTIKTLMAAVKTNH